MFAAGFCKFRTTTIWTNTKVMVGFDLDNGFGGQGHSHDCRKWGRGGWGVVLHEAWDVMAPRHALRLAA